MNRSPLYRLLPLSGVAFVVIAVGVFALMGGSPDESATRSEVVSWYSDSESATLVAAMLALVGTMALVGFVASLARSLRVAGGEIAAVAVACGGAILGAGLLVDATIGMATASAAEKGLDGAAVTLNQIYAFDWVPLVGGLGVILLSAGLGALRGRILPAPLAWFGIILGVLALSPAGFGAFMLSPLWILAVSITLYRAQETPSTGSVGPVGARA